MFSKISPLLLALTAAVSVNAITVSTPPVNKCQDVTFDIGGATGPVYFTVLPAENSCESDSIAEYGPITVANGQYTWVAPDVEPGTTIVILVDDAQTGEEVWSAPITIGGSPDACVAAASSTDTSASGTSSDTASSTDTGRPTVNNISGSGNSNTPENAAEGPASTGAALPVKAQASVGLLVALAGVVATFA